MHKTDEKIRIGRTDVEVTRLGLGAASIGNLLKEVSEEDAQAILETAFEAGIRYIDTAPFYGCGLSECRIGKALVNKNRDEYVISTKVGRLIRPGKRTGSEIYGNNKPYYLANLDMCSRFDFSYDGVMQSHEESLERLGLDRVDILHIHDPDDHLDSAVRGAYRALDDLRSDGTIKAVSAGMNQWEMLSQFMDHGDFDCFLLAGRYSLLDQSALTEFLPKCLEHGVSIILGGVFNSGLLADPRPGITFNYVEAPQHLINHVISISRICDAHGVPLKAAALQFPMAHPSIACILTGVSSVSELKENERLFEYPIPESLWRDLKSEGILSEEAPVFTNEEQAQ